MYYYSSNVSLNEVWIQGLEGYRAISLYVQDVDYLVGWWIEGGIEV